MAVADPIPVRALNQVTYCQRLYYLQYVDAVMPVNEHVEGGLFDHRRVDSPELANKTRTDRGAAASRGVALASEVLGISGVLDVVEEKNGEQYPVETKHGPAPHDDDGKPTVWENDAVQLCAQAMLLEESSGTPVPRGFQFHVGSRERVEVNFTDELRAKTRAAIARCRELEVLDSPPEPLPPELRHRCFGCSLAGVCLPDETLYQINRPADSEAASHPDVRRVIPSSDDGAVLYLQEPGSSVGKRSEHLVVKKDGKELTRIPMHSVRQVVVVGNVQVSTQALETLAANDIAVSYVTGHGRFIGAFAPAPAKNVSLREAQFRQFADPAVCLTLSRAVVRAKLANQRAYLMRNLRGDDSRGSDDPAAHGLWALLRGLDDAASIDSLLGMEGQGAALYFAEFGRFLKPLPDGRRFDFAGRNRRPPRDPVNALLSFAYAMLAKDCFSAVCTVGFDPYKGFFHQGRHGKPSLALDLMEEFRSVIADSVVISLINNEMLRPSDFIFWRDACQLTDSGRRTFFQAYEQRKATEITHPVYGYRMSYARMLEVQARMLAAFIRGGIPEYTGFMVR